MNYQYDMFYANAADCLTTLSTYLLWTIWSRMVRRIIPWFQYNEFYRVYSLNSPLAYCRSSLELLQFVSSFRTQASALFSVNNFNYG